MSELGHRTPGSGGWGPWDRIHATDESCASRAAQEGSITGERRRGFSLVEIVATLLVVMLGLAAVLGMARLGLRWSGEAIAVATGMSTAQTALVDAQPGGLTADASDADQDGWRIANGSLSIPATGAYSFAVEGVLNGFYVRRSESSSATDILDAHGRAADVSVDVFWGQEGRYVTGLKQRIVRRY